MTKLFQLMNYALKSRGQIKLRQVASEQQGLIFLTGPTGCGKTTTMYSLTAHCVNHLEPTCDHT